jgi:hypothetical protein
MAIYCLFEVPEWWGWKPLAVLDNGGQLLNGGY